MTDIAQSDGAASNAASTNILIVDDEEDILPEYQEFLEIWGYHCLICNDPQESIRLVLQEPNIRLVITDERMAGIDGTNMIEKLRASVPAERDLKFILITGDITYQPKKDMMDVPVFFKPPDTNALLAAIRTALSAMS